MITLQRDASVKIDEKVGHGGVLVSPGAVCVDKSIARLGTGGGTKRWDDMLTPNPEVRKTREEIPMHIPRRSAILAAGVALSLMAAPGRTGIRNAKG